MQLDLVTLYGLAIGTLVVCATMTLWERQTRPERSAELGVWAGGYLLLAAGCALAISRAHFPGMSGSAISNLVILSGYLLILHGVARLDGGHHLFPSAALLAGVALAWWLGGADAQPLLWNYRSAVPIALICGVTAWRLLHSPALRGLRSRPVPMAISAAHALFYAGRAFALPPLVAAFGDDLLRPVAQVTMYEGVLYSVAMPMALLALLREEGQRALLTASRTDFLTGLGNRQRFFEEGSALVRRHTSLSLLAFDLDHFKTINDRHGHAAGDAVLQSFAQVARDTIGPGALLVRLGGEEFAALLPGHDAQWARQVGEAVAKRFAATAHGKDGGIRATVSVGLAELGVDGTDLPSLLGTADRALYCAKALGRNRIELAPPLALAIPA